MAHSRLLPTTMGNVLPYKPRGAALVHSRPGVISNSPCKLPAHRPVGGPAAVVSTQLRAAMPSSALDNGAATGIPAASGDAAAPPADYSKASIKVCAALILFCNSCKSR